MINITANVTDGVELSFCQFVDNQSLADGAKNFFNKTVTGTKDQCSQNYTIYLAAGGVINFTVIVNDTSKNLRTNDTIITVVSAANQNPVVYLLNESRFSVDPVSGGTTSIIITFNATDPDNVEQINGTSGGRVIVNLTLGEPSTAQFRTQSSCTNTTRGSGSTGIVTFNCTVDMYYYDNNSANWVVNISVIDSNSGVGRNDSNGSKLHTFTYNALAAFSLISRGVSEGANLNFTSLFLNDQNKPAKAPLLLNNTGNNDFDQINITGAALIGITTPSQTIAALQFFVNATSNATAGAGMPLSNSPQTIPGTDDTANATLLHGPSSTGDTPPYSGVADFRSKGNQTLLFWIDVPVSGLSSQTYNNTWNMTVVDLS